MITVIEEIRAQNSTFEYNGKTFEVEPMILGDQLEVEQNASTEKEQNRLMLRQQLEQLDGAEFGEDDSIDDVSLGFLSMLGEAIEEANGMEGFTDDQLRQAQQADL